MPTDEEMRFDLERARSQRDTLDMELRTAQGQIANLLAERSHLALAIATLTGTHEVDRAGLLGRLRDVELRANQEFGERVKAEREVVELKGDVESASMVAQAALRPREPGSTPDDRTLRQLVLDLKRELEAARARAEKAEQDAASVRASLVDAETNRELQKLRADALHAELTKLKAKRRRSRKGRR